MTDPSLYERVAQLEVAVKDLNAQMAALQQGLQQLEVRIWQHDWCRPEKATEKKPSKWR